MIKKILQGYMDKLHNLIPDEIREFVKYTIEFQEGTENDFYISLFINADKPKKYQIRVDNEKIKVTDISPGKVKSIEENDFLQEFKTILEKYKKLCNKAEIPAINPATKKLLTVAKEIRNEFPEEIRWLAKIEQSEKKVTLTFPRNLEEVQKENPQGRCKIEFTWKNEIILTTYEGIHNDEIQEPWEILGERLKATKALIGFLQELLKKLEN